MPTSLSGSGPFFFPCLLPLGHPHHCKRHYLPTTCAVPFADTPATLPYPFFPTYHHFFCNRPPSTLYMPGLLRGGILTYLDSGMLLLFWFTYIVVTQLIHLVPGCSFIPILYLYVLYFFLLLFYVFYVYAYTTYYAPTPCTLPLYLLLTHSAALYPYMHTFRGETFCDSVNLKGVGHSEHAMLFRCIFRIQLKPGHYVEYGEGQAGHVGGRRRRRFSTACAYRLFLFQGVKRKKLSNY